MTHFKRTTLLIMAAIAVMGLFIAGCSRKTEQNLPTDYGITENWAYFDDGDNKEADVFLICPTVDMRDAYNMSLDDTETKANFLGALNMERGIYEESARLYAPYYHQAAMKVYSLDPKGREPYLDIAY